MIYVEAVESHKSTILYLTTPLIIDIKLLETTLLRLSLDLI